LPQATLGVAIRLPLDKDKSVLGEPARTQYDLNFNVLGFPVRVHPFFWLLGLILGGRIRGEDAGLLILIWIVSLFASILIHELGHSLMMRRFGISSHIVLHLMGGLAISDSSSFGAQSRNSRSSILISFAGPAAGFVFAGLIILGIMAMGGDFIVDFDNPFPFYRFRLNPIPEPGSPLPHLVHALLFINILWGLVNLLPVYPLDGGQIARTVMIDQDPGGGAIKSLWLSVFVGGAMGVFGATRGDYFVAIMFGMLAFQSYMAIQQMRGGGRFGQGGGGKPW
jgi:Zn-dependent protease